MTDTARGPHTEALMREALLGAGTSVWEWDIRSDRLASVDTSTALLGYAAGEVPSDQVSWNALIHPDDRDANHDAYLRHARGEAPLYEHEYRARAKDGSWRWIVERGRIVERDAAGAPLRMMGTLTDITPRRRAELEAVEMGRRLHEIARHVPGMVYQYRTHPDRREPGVFTYVSDSCVGLLGVEPAELLADSAQFFRLIRRRDLERVTAGMFQAQQSLRLWRSEFQVYPRHAPARWLSGAATPKREADGSVVWHGSALDVTELHVLGQAREEAAAARAASRAKTEFLSRVSHELRTPLNAVLGFAQLLELDNQDPLSTEQRRRVGLIRDAGAHLLSMISELLDLTRIEAGQVVVTPTEQPLAALLADCVEMVRPQADAASVHLRAELPPAQATLWVDATRLRQVLLNLLGNAIKYNRPGGTVLLRTEPPGPDDALAWLHVSDTGIGIAAADLPRLFEPFNRGAHQHSSIEGAGIGLAVTRALVDAMGGRMEVHSKPGTGSTFSVALPSRR